MGWGALIGGAISAIGGIAGSAMGGGGGGGDTGAEAGTLKRARSIYIDPFVGGGYWNLDVPGMAQQSIGFGLQQAPGINAANMRQLQSLLNQALPGYQGMVGQMGANVSSMLGGNVPTDVQNQIQRSAAYRSLMGGTAGAGTGTTGAITARDLGLTSLQLQETGFTQGSNLLQLSRNYLMPQPVNPLSLLPLSDLIQGGEWQREARFQANLAGYTAASNQAAAQVGVPQMNPVTGVTGALSGLAGSFSQTNPQTGQSGWNMLASLFGGGGGGGFTGVGASGDPFEPGGSLAF